jgi:hypothetical protein
MDNICFSKAHSTIVFTMNLLSLKRNYWTHGVRIVDVIVIQVARVTRPVHEEHVRVATTPVIRTPENRQPSHTSYVQHYPI